MSLVTSPPAKATFEPLFNLTSSQLASRQARRMSAIQKPGFPCRVSLSDANVGEEVIVVNYEIAAELSHGKDLEACFEEMFYDVLVKYIHILLRQTWMLRGTRGPHVVKPCRLSGIIFQS